MVWILRCCVKILAGIEGSPLGDIIDELEVDVDDDLIIETEQLIVPHPRMHNREFVLRPINDLAPELIHPVFNKSIRQMLDELSTQNQQCLLMEEAVH